MHQNPKAHHSQNNDPQTTNEHSGAARTSCQLSADSCQLIADCS